MTTSSIITLQRVLIACATVVTLLALLPSLASAALTRQLEIGMRGSDVGELQTFLARDNTIYPQGLVTNYFGNLTRSAVSNFQARNGIETVGRVGPITLAAINAQMAGGSTGDVTVPIISNLNLNTTATSATFSWTTNEPTRGTVYYGTSWLSEYELPHSVTIGGTPAMTDTSLRSSQNITISGLQPSTTYYYDVYVTDAAGNASMTMQTTFKTTN